MCLLSFFWLLRLSFNQWFEQFDYYVIDVVCLVFLLGFFEHLGPGGILVLSNLGKSGHYLFKYFFVSLPSSSRNTNYILVRLLKVFPQLTDGLSFPFFLWFILMSFFCCVFKFTHFLLGFVYSVVNSIYYIFHLRHCNFYL